MGDKQRPGKHHRVQKLVDIWLVFRQIPSLRNSRGGTCTASFDTFIGIMSRYDSRAKKMVTTNTNTFRNWRSDAMPAGERNREYLKGGGAVLNKVHSVMIILIITLHYILFHWTEN